MAHQKNRKMLAKSCVYSQHIGLVAEILPVIIFGSAHADYTNVMHSFKRGAYEERVRFNNNDILIVWLYRYESCGSFEHTRREYLLQRLYQFRSRRFLL